MVTEWVALMLRSARDTRLPADAEFRASFRACIEWARGWRWSQAEAILEQLCNGSMPCDGRWAQARADAFDHWVTTGTRQRWLARLWSVRRGHQPLEDS